MITTLASIALAVLLAGAILLAIAARQPNQFGLSRTLPIAAPPERLFPLINDLRLMNTWNPFALRDPNATGSYSEPSSGRGAAHHFAGPKSGAGHIEIVDVTEPSKVTMRLVMTKPIKADNRVEFTLAPNGNGTNVTWAMSGPQPLVGKIMSLFISCDRMMGKEFEQGLANLKAIAEAAPPNRRLAS